MNEQLEWPIEIIRSDRRRKSVSAALKEGTLIVRAPDTMDDETLQPIIAKLQKRLHEKVNQPPPTAADLEKRAQELNKKYFHGRLRWESIRYVTNQNKRYGSCTPAEGAIRLSHRLADLPAWVRDYVLMHELAHLLEGNHGPNFWRLVKRYPLTERARGYLMDLGMEEESGK